MEADVTGEAVSSALKFLEQDSKKSGALNRWSFVHPSGKRFDRSGPCFWELRPEANNREVSPPTGCLTVTYSGGHGAYSNGVKYEYGDDSKDFVEFLVGPESPWRSSLVPFLVFKDPKKIFDDRGFIFGNLSEINFLVLKNFLIATRMCMEFPNKFQVMKTLISKGVSRFDSYITAQSFSTVGGTFNVSYQSGHEPFSSHEMALLIDRLRSGEVNGTHKSFYGGKEIKTVSCFLSFSSPFYSEIPRQIKSIYDVSSPSLEVLLKYAKSLSDNVPEVSGTPEPRKKRMPVCINRGPFEAKEEIDF